MTRIIATLLFALLPLGAFAGPFTPTGEKQSYWGLVLGSQHINPKTPEAADLNDFTPGITYGKRYQLSMDSAEGFLEGGVFYNSYEEVSPVFLAGYTFRVIDFGASELRLGAFTGIGYYKELGQSLHEEYGLPYVEGFIPLAGASIVYRRNAHELRLTTVPADNLDLILNLSYTHSF